MLGYTSLQDLEASGCSGNALLGASYLSCNQEIAVQVGETQGIVKGKSPTCSDTMIEQTGVIRSRGKGLGAKHSDTGACCFAGLPRLERRYLNRRCVRWSEETSKACGHKVEALNMFHMFGAHFKDSKHLKLKLLLAKAASMQLCCTDCVTQCVQ